MKQLLITVSILAVLSLLVGCSRVDKPYEIVVDDGEYYLIMDSTIKDANKEIGTGLTVSPSISFDSIDEMKNDIITGNFTEQELEQLAQFDTDDTGRIRLFDLNELYAPICPFKIDSYRVTWDGNSYCFCVDDPNTELHLCHSICSKSYFDEYVNDYSNFLTEHPAIDLVSQSTEPDRNAMVYVYGDNIELQFKFVYYPLTVDNQTLHIGEYYSLVESADIPDYVNILGTNGDVYFNIQLYHLQERPSIEWLSELGAQEYIETSTS